MKLLELHVDLNYKNERVYSLEMPKEAMELFNYNPLWIDELKDKISHGFSDTLLRFADGENILGKEAPVLNIEVTHSFLGTTANVNSRQYVHDLVSGYDKSQIEKVRNIHNQYVEAVAHLSDKYLKAISLV